MPPAASTQPVFFIRELYLHSFSPLTVGYKGGTQTYRSPQAAQNDSAMTTRPNKRFRSDDNALRHINNLRSLGLSFHQPGDAVIQHSHISQDGRRVYKETRSAAPIPQSQDPSLQSSDWNDFEFNDAEPVSQGTTEDRFVFQVKKGKVTRLPKRKIYSS
ncbi:hypothetical protein VKT23_020433, partial [Stygiomarasmius scandens]